MFYPEKDLTLATLQRDLNALGHNMTSSSGGKRRKRTGGRKKRKKVKTRFQFREYSDNRLRPFFSSDNILFLDRLRTILSSGNTQQSEVSGNS